MYLTKRAGAQFPNPFLPLAFKNATKHNRDLQGQRQSGDNPLPVCGTFRERFKTW